MPRPRLRQYVVPTLLHLCFLATIAQSAPASDVYPSELMNWMAESDEYAFIVEQSRQKLSVWKTRNGEPVMVESYPCVAGLHSIPSRTWASNDHLGVFFLCSVIGEESLPKKFGSPVMVTDFPRLIDRMRGWRDEGIWLHGGDPSLLHVPSLKGSVCLRNEHLKKIVRYARLQRTPVILVNQIVKKTRAEIMGEEREVRSFVEQWRRAWEAKDLATYAKCYSTNFQSENKDIRAWTQRRREMNQQSGDIEVRIGQVSLYAHEDLVTAMFPFTYKNGAEGTSGIRTLYISRLGGLKIVGEDYVSAAENPFIVNTSGLRVRPVAASRNPGSPINKTVHPSRDYLARLDSAPDIESPRLSPPSVAMIPDSLEHLNGKMQTAKSQEPWDKEAGTAKIAQRSRAAGGHELAKSPGLASKKHQTKAAPKTNRVVKTAERPSTPQNPLVVAHSIAAALYFSPRSEPVETPLMPLPGRTLMEPFDNKTRKAR